MILVEQAVLRALLAPLYDSTRALKLPSGIHDDMVLALARHHRLSPALAAVVSSSVSPYLADRFQADRLVTLGRGIVLRQTLGEVAHALQSAGVTAALLKGMAHEAMVYPMAGTRPATDIDLLVRPETRSAAFDVFRHLGFQPSLGAPGFDEPDYHEVTLCRAGTYVDLHFGLAPFIRGAIDYDDLWSATVVLPIADIPVQGLSRHHAALHQALHMAVHHFDVPALYLLDLARLCAAPEVATRAYETAGAWRCLRAWETATALTASFIADARNYLTYGAASEWPARSRRVVHRFGGLSALARWEQFLRKFEHFDNATDAARYLLEQGRRGIRERLLAQLSTPPSPAERLRW